VRRLRDIIGAEWVFVFELRDTVRTVWVYDVCVRLESN